MQQCLLVQPMHERGVEYLRAAGLDVQLAPASDMTTIARMIGDAVAVITRNAGLDSRAMDVAHELRVIGNHGVGLDPVDVPHATALGIPVVNTPYTNASSVAELAVSLMLAVLKRLPQADQATRKGNFDFKYHSDLRELSGKTVGIVGFGTIGRATATMLRAFNVNLLVYTRSDPDKEIMAHLSAKRCHSLLELAKASDIVSLHLPHTETTTGLIGESFLGHMKPTAVLINTSRGAVVKEVDLLEALTWRRIAGAGLDVYATETMPAGYPLLELDNVLLTPHIGGSTHEALERTAIGVAKQVIDVLNGIRPVHLVNDDVWGRRRQLT